MRKIMRQLKDPMTRVFIAGDDPFDPRFSEYVYSIFVFCDFCKYELQRLDLSPSDPLPPEPHYYAITEDLCSSCQKTLEAYIPSLFSLLFDESEALRAELSSARSALQRSLVVNASLNNLPSLVARLQSEALSSVSREHAHLSLLDSAADLLETILFQGKPASVDAKHQIADSAVQVINKARTAIEASSSFQEEVLTRQARENYQEATSRKERRERKRAFEKAYENLQKQRRNQALSVLSEQPKDQGSILRYGRQKKLKN